MSDDDRVSLGFLILILAIFAAIGIGLVMHSFGIGLLGFCSFVILFREVFAISKQGQP